MQKAPPLQWRVECRPAIPSPGEQRTALSYADAIREVADENPYVSEVRVFDCLGEMIAGAAHPDDDRRMAVARGEDVLVSVEDDGPGIPDEKKSYLFARFSGGDGEKSGRGLGLYICRMLVERYCGRIRADDRVAGRPEEGAAIRFTLRKAG